jgi:hypothetical protein
MKDRTKKIIIHFVYWIGVILCLVSALYLVGLIQDIENSKETILDFLYVFLFCFCVIWISIGGFIYIGIIEEFDM